MDPITISDKVPDWVTAIGSFLVFLTTFGFAAYGWFKSKLPIEGKKDESDAVVLLSAAIADSKSISKLADAIEVLCDHLALERDLSKLQHEVLNERLKLILGELRKSNERDEREDDARRISLR
jgi:hypothetical protein